MTAVILGVAVVGAILLWPVNRWAVKGDGRAEVYGFWGTLVAAILAAIIASGVGQPLSRGDVWAIGALIGFAFVTGYWLVIMYCLKIGPVGPTVAMNNMGLVWAVLAGTLWLKPHTPGGILVAGFIITCCALVLMGFSKNNARGAIQSHQAITPTWVLWAFVGWTLAGVSMSGQVALSARPPNCPASIVVAYSATASVLLAPIAFRAGLLKRRREMVAGVLAGVLTVLVGTMTQTALSYWPAEAVFPITLGAPVLVMTILGKFIYKEHLSTLGWFACFLGVVGIVLLSLGQAMAK